MPLTNGRNTPKREVNLLVIPVKAAVNIHPGALVAMNGAFAQPGAVATGLKAAGRAETMADNRLGDDGDMMVTVSRGCFLFANSATDPVEAADLLTTCYIEDDETVSATDATGARSAAGKVIGLEDGGVWVQIG